jgi:carboxyl-terminal processing protease
MTDQTPFPTSDGAPSASEPSTAATSALSHQPSRRAITQTIALMLILVLLCGGMGIYILSDKSVRAAYSLATTAAEIERTYPGQLDWHDVFERSVDGMTSILDRYSGYLTVNDFGRLDEEFEGEYVGIGVSVIRDPLGLLVMSVRENGPAATVGVLTGDIITAIGDSSIRLFDAQRSIKLLRGKEGTTVAITIFRPVTHDTLSVTVVRKTLDLVHIPFAGLTPDSVVYIRLLDFEGGASDDIEAALDSLVVNKTPRPHGLILDLRGNPGGLFHEAYQIADLFLSGGMLIVGTESRSRWKTEEHFASGDDVTGGLPMAVLVDRGSASAAEIVAGALQKNRRAILVGDTTFGKGLVQGFTRFQDGDGLRLTISRYYLAGKTYLNEVDSVVHDSGIGLPPDSVFDFIELQRFPLALERSLLLQKFAHQYESDILEADSLLTVQRNLASRFEKFAGENGFVFQSDLASAASIVADLSRLDEAGRNAEQDADALLAAAHRRDLRLFEQYDDYIEFRLRQIAVEHRLGGYQSYARVVTRYRPDIRYAASLLKAGK